MLKSCVYCSKLHKIGDKCQFAPKPEDRFTGRRREGWQRKYTGTNEDKIRSSYKWKTVREIIRSKANYMCELCKHYGFLSYQSVQIHHIESLAERKDLAYTASNLICLCENCHKQVEGDTQVKPLLKELAMKREKTHTTNSTKQPPVIY